MHIQKRENRNVLRAPRPKGDSNAVSWIHELHRLVWFALASVLMLALVSHSPKDPSWSTWSTNLTIHNWMGRVGSITADLLLQFLGLSAFGLPLLLAGLALLRRERGAAKLTKSLVPGALLFVVSFSGLLQKSIPQTWLFWSLKYPGGLLGKGTAFVLEFLVSDVGTLLVSAFGLVASLILLFQRQLISETAAWLKRAIPLAKQRLVEFVLLRVERLRERLVALRAKFARRAARTPEITPHVHAPMPVSEVFNPSPIPELEAGSETVVSVEGESTNRDLDELSRMVGSSRVSKEKSAPTGASRNTRFPKKYQLPQLSMLSGKADTKQKSVDKNWYSDKANILVQKLADFGVEGEVVNISPGPVITVYEFKPASGVKIKDIANLSDDLTLALSVMSVRIVAPIPGKPVVGIEIPSPHRETVYFKDMLQETPFYSGDIRIPVVLGRLASGEPVAADLASMPHLLVAGTTGTGKSVFINTLISSLIFRFTPHQLKLILVDPKMVELSQYEGIPHLLLPVVVDSKKAVMALRWAVEEMEMRYTRMHQSGVRHIDAYNHKLGEMGTPEGTEENPFMPYLVVVIDEFADLMAVVPKDVELSIARLAQKARASGIHLVLATQRPSTDVVTGTIKANFPSRISFRVASGVDSKTILDRPGADRLLGHGDMLFHSAGFSSIKRMQGSFISDADMIRVVEFLKSQGAPEYNEKILQPTEAESTDWTDDSLSEEEKDNRLYDAAVKIVSDKGEASISLIQRHLKIGYNRAASLMEQMEAEGVVAQSTGNSKRRQVLVNNI